MGSGCCFQGRPLLLELEPFLLGEAATLAPLSTGASTEGAATAAQAHDAERALPAVAVLGGQRLPLMDLRLRRLTYIRVQHGLSANPANLASEPLP
jgi:hypothetical protein